MVSKLSYIITENTVPYRNLALEQYLTFHAEEGECILYLWQNRHTVVIGKNQNCWKECKVNYLEEDGGYLVRRMSGGGAVFHDLGNLNFTFCVRKEDYDISRQLDVICRAVENLGLHAEKTGRNDITIDGRKFSGNAFYESNGYCYHHGTILLNVDKTNMSKYLNVSKEKLASKSVDSVRSRVANLSEFCPGITVARMEDELIRAFAEVYKAPITPFPENRLNMDEIEENEKVFESWEWKYGRKIPFEFEMSRRFSWGDIDLQIAVNGGVIKEINAFSDAMDQEFIAAIPDALEGCVYEEKAMMDVVRGIAGNSEEQKVIAEDICRLIKESL